MNTSLDAHGQPGWVHSSEQKRPAFWDTQKLRQIDASAPLTFKRSFFNSRKLQYVLPVTLVTLMAITYIFENSLLLLFGVPASNFFGGLTLIACALFLITIIMGRLSGRKVGVVSDTDTNSAQILQFHTDKLSQFAALEPLPYGVHVLTIIAGSHKQFLKPGHDSSLNWTSATGAHAVHVRDSAGHELYMYPVHQRIFRPNYARNWRNTIVASVWLAGNQAIPPVTVRHTTPMSSLFATLGKVDRDHEWRMFNKKFSVDTPLRNHPIFTPTIMRELYDFPATLEWTFNGDRVIITSDGSIPCEILYRHIWRVIYAIPGYLYS